MGLIFCALTDFKYKNLVKEQILIFHSIFDIFGPRNLEKLIVFKFGHFLIQKEAKS